MFRKSGERAPPERTGEAEALRRLRASSVGAGDATACLDAEGVPSCGGEARTGGVELQRGTIDVIPGVHHDIVDGFLQERADIMQRLRSEICAFRLGRNLISF